MRKYKHHCHCAFSSEVGTCIINNAGRQASHKKHKYKNCLWRPYFLIDRNEKSNLNRGPSIDASYQVSVHLAKRFLKLTNQKQELSTVPEMDGRPVAKCD